MEWRHILLLYSSNNFTLKMAAIVTETCVVRKVCLKYIINSEAHFVGYLNFMEKINTRKMEHTKIIFRHICNCIITL